MKQVALEAQVRTQTGKGAARQLRAAGRLPAVLYGSKGPTVVLSVNGHELNTILSASQGEQILFSLDLRDNGNTGKRLALIKELQRHPVNDKVRHIDFYEVFMDQAVEVEVPLALVGKAKGVEVDKGMIEVVQRAVRVSCLPMAMPREIQLDVSNLGLGEALHVSDVLPPAGVKLLEDPGTTLVTIVGSRIQEEAPKAEEEPQPE